MPAEAPTLLSDERKEQLANSVRELKQKASGFFSVRSDELSIQRSLWSKYFDFRTAPLTEKLDRLESSSKSDVILFAKLVLLLIPTSPILIGAVVGAGVLSLFDSLSAAGLGLRKPSSRVDRVNEDAFLRAGIVGSSKRSSAVAHGLQEVRALWQDDHKRYSLRDTQILHSDHFLSLLNSTAALHNDPLTPEQGEQVRYYLIELTKQVAADVFQIDHADGQARPQLSMTSAPERKDFLYFSKVANSRALSRMFMRELVKAGVVDVNELPQAADKLTIELVTKMVHKLPDEIKRLTDAGVNLDNLISEFHQRLLTSIFGDLPIYVHPPSYEEPPKY